MASRIFLLALAFLQYAFIMAQNIHSSFNVTIAPVYEGNNPKYLDLRLVIETPDLSANQSLLNLLSEDSDQPIQASDLNGILPVTQDTERRVWNISRPTSGDVTVTYNFSKGISGKRGGPLVDVRRDQKGINSATAALIFFPAVDKTYNVQWTWDLTGAPDGSRGVWTYGEGTVIKALTSKIAADSLFAVGPDMNSYPPTSSGPVNAAFYWFGKVNFDIDTLAPWTLGLLPKYGAFFNDTDPTYRVFVRRNEIAGSSGTSNTRSFMFSYDLNINRTLESFQSLLSHELIHNWPTFSGPDSTWYVEGAADYYAAVLPFRFNIYSTDRFIQELNYLATGYYTNRYCNLSNAGIEKLGDESDAGTIPYGRGNIILVNWDTLIRQKTNGTRSFDNVMLELLQRSRLGLSDDTEALLTIMDRELGARGRVEYGLMRNGSGSPPPDGSHSPCLRVRKTEQELYEVGWETEDRNGTTIIRKVVSSSRAEKAGLKVGDEFLWRGDPANEHYDKDMVVKIRRDGQEQIIGYRPRSFQKVTSYQWAMKDGIPGEACRPK